MIFAATGGGRGGGGETPVAGPVASGEPGDACACLPARPAGAAAAGGERVPLQRGGQPARPQGGDVTRRRAQQQQGTPHTQPHHKSVMPLRASALV